MHSHLVPQVNFTLVNPQMCDKQNNCHLFRALEYAFLDMMPTRILCRRIDTNNL